jgi:hypothetical protein
MVIACLSSPLSNNLEDENEHVSVRSLSKEPPLIAKDASPAHDLRPHLRSERHLPPDLLPALALHQIGQLVTLVNKRRPQTGARQAIDLYFPLSLSAYWAVFVDALDIDLIHWKGGDDS